MITKIGKGIAIIVLVFIGVISGVYVNNNYIQINQNSVINQKEELEDVVTVPLEPFLSNIETGGVGRKYLRVTISIEVYGEDDAELINEKVERVRDSVSGYISKSTEEEINKQEEFKNGLKEGINDSLGEDIVRGILITDRVIQ